MLGCALLGGVVATASPAKPVAAGQRAAPLVPLGGMLEHLGALQRIADRNGGNRAAGTAGYDASSRYVARRLRAAGYRVQVQRFAFPFVADRSPPLLQPVGEWSFRAGRDYGTLEYSGSGRVEARVVAVDLLVPSPGVDTSTSGCESSDFATFPRGSVALLQRGTCTFRRKIANAIAAGAVAAVVVNEGNPGRRGVFEATLGPPQASVPALAASFAVGEALRDGALSGPTGTTVRVSTDIVAESRRASNVIAESRAGNAANVVMAGAHLDSVRRGPGINDNGSGSATLLELAEGLAGVRPRNRVRFAWWGAEELGLVGSRRYVAGLSRAERRRIALYLNFDMVASPNFVPFVYDGDRAGSPPGSAAVERALVRSFRAQKLPHRETSIGDSSDHAPFADAGIPVGGLFTGAGARKSAAEARVFGGMAGEPYDPCYHRACDTLANVNRVALARMARVTAHAIMRFARDVSGIRRLR
jgi:Zn-dependent M28 family amino/carboxypeptidase